MGELQSVARDEVEPLLEGHGRVGREALGKPRGLGHIPADGQIVRLEQRPARSQLPVEPRSERLRELFGALHLGALGANGVGLVGERAGGRHLRDALQKQARQLVQAPRAHRLLAELREHA